MTCLERLELSSHTLDMFLALNSFVSSWLQNFTNTLERGGKRQKPSYQSPNPGLGLPLLLTPCEDRSGILLLYVSKRSGAELRTRILNKIVQRRKPNQRAS